MKQNYNIFRAMLPGLYEKAERMFKELSFLPTGTYSAIRLDRLFRENIKGYLKNSRSYLKLLKSLKDNGDDERRYKDCYFPADIMEVSVDGMSLKFPSMALWYVLWKIEIYAGLNCKERKTFTVEPIGEVQAEGFIEFPRELMMKKISKRINRDYNEANKRNNNYSVLFDCQNGTINFGCELENSINSYKFKLDIDEEENVITRFPSLNLHALYGKCIIKVYKNIDILYVVFQNEKGELISNHEFSIDPAEIQNQFWKIFDRQDFYSEIKRRPQVKMVSQSLF